MKKLIVFLILFTGISFAQQSILTPRQQAMVKGYILDSLSIRDAKIDSIFQLIADIVSSNPDVDDITITLTSGEPQKLQINVTWLDGRVDSLITDRIGGYTIDDLENVLATTPDNNSILIYRQDTGFWETTPYITGGSVSNADSLGGQPASAYVRKSDSTIIFATPSQLNSGLALKLNYDFSGYNDGTITNTDLLIYQDVNSGTPRRITFSNFRSGLNIPDTTSLSNRINLKLNATDTLSLSNRINLKLNATDTTSLSNRINLKLNATDTLSLSNRINTKLTATDTLSLSNRINLKLNITDTTAFRTFSDLKYLLSSALNTYWDSVAVKNYLAEILQGDSIIGDKATLDSLILAFWNDELGGGGGVPQDSLNTKLYSSFNTEYPQVSNPSVDNYIPVLTGTGNQYAVLDDLPISSAVSSALSGKQNALGFTPENVSNKATNLTSPDNTKYPTTLAVSTAIETILNEGDARVPYMWVYLELDTIPSMTSFSPATDVEVSTLTESNVIGMNTYDVSYHSISGQGNPQYRTKRGSTWSSWGNTWQILKAVDSAQVRLTSSDLTETTLACTLTAGGQTQIFSVTTLAPVEPVMPDPPTGFIAYGGTSTTEIPMEWTDPEGSIDSIRVYEGSANDTTAMTWIASVGSGVEAYNRTGRTAETTYWYAVKSWDGELESYFSNLDSATTLAESGGFHPHDLNPVAEWLHSAGVTKSGSNTVISWQEQINNYTIADGDTSASKIIHTDSSLYFSSTASHLVDAYVDTTGGLGTGNPVFNIKGDTYSIETWVNLGDDFTYLLRNYGMGGDGFAAAFYASEGLFGRLAFYTGIETHTNSPVNLYQQGWKHVVFVYGRSYVAIYVDSVLTVYNTSTAITDLAGLWYARNGAAYIGYDNLGNLAVLRVYRYALTPANVKSLYEYGRQ